MAKQEAMRRVRPIKYARKYLNVQASTCSYICRCTLTATGSDDRIFIRSGCMLNNGSIGLADIYGIIRSIFDDAANYAVESHIYVTP